MPRKKTTAADPAAPAIAAAPASILCPACKSKIGSDGKTLHEKSTYLEELIETDSSVDELEKTLEKKLIERDATIADLRGRLAAAETRLEGEFPIQPEVKKEKPHGTVQQTADGKTGKPSWWD